MQTLLLRSSNKSFSLKIITLDSLHLHHHHNQN